MTNSDRNTLNTRQSSYGTVGKLDDGNNFVRFERLLNHSTESVWQTITEPESLAKWFPGFSLELRLGGKFEIWFGGDCDGPAHVEGRITKLEPERILECGSMRWELCSADNGCLLVFTDILQFTGSSNKIEFTNSVLGGWHNYMDFLEDGLDGKMPDFDKPEINYANIQVAGRDELSDNH